MRIIGIDPGVATTGWAILDIQPANAQKVSRVRKNNSLDGQTAENDTSKDISSQQDLSVGSVVYGSNMLKLIDFGIIETAKSLELPERLNEISQDLREILEKYEPELSGVESLLFYNNAKTAISVGEARGVVLLELHRFGLPIKEMTPLQVKNTICGYGKADKKQVQNNVMRICNLKVLPKPDDAADAVAIAICSFYM